MTTNIRKRPALPMISVNVSNNTVSADNESNEIRNSTADDIHTMSWARCWRLWTITGSDHVSGNRHV